MPWSRSSRVAWAPSKITVSPLSSASQQRLRGVGDVGLEPVAVVDVFLDHRVQVEARVRDAAVDPRSRLRVLAGLLAQFAPLHREFAQRLLLGLQRGADLGPQDLLVEQVLDADAEPQRLVGVAGADAAAGGADRELAQLGLAGRVEQHVVGHDQVGVGGDPQVADADPGSFEARRSRPSSTRGSTTTPLPITQVFSEWRMPEGIRWNLNSSPSRTIVWPALLPPWKRTIIVGPLGEQVGDLALALVAPLGADYDHAWHARRDCDGFSRRARSLVRGWSGAEAAAAGRRRSRPGAKRCAAPICSSSCCLVEVGRDQHRALGLVALVDQRVELLQHPVGAFLGAEVVDVEQVDRGEALEEGE